jgi:hypothetical protein
MLQRASDAYIVPIIVDFKMYRMENILAYRKEYAGKFIPCLGKNQKRNDKFGNKHA